MHAPPAAAWLVLDLSTLSLLISCSRYPLLCRQHASRPSLVTGTPFGLSTRGSDSETSSASLAGPISSRLDATED
jgi:hypothetical protein